MTQLLITTIVAEHYRLFLEHTVHYVYDVCIQETLRLETPIRSQKPDSFPHIWTISQPWVTG